jgi:hypothetical protein
MSISRRRFLGGAGALISLPFFASLRGRGARAAGPPPRKQRFVGFYLPCGIVMNNWTPAAEGAAWSSPILDGLGDYRDRVLVLSGLDNIPGRSEGGGDHAAGTGSFLTCTHVRKTADTDILNGISFDQLVAPVLSSGLAFPSLELGTTAGGNTGNCDTGYSCAYTTTVAWAGPTSPLPKQTNPRAVFDRLFGGYDPDATAAEIMKRQLYRTSVLDGAADQATSLKGRLGRTDQAKLDEYLTAVRELEDRINRPVTVCDPGTAPPDGLAFHDRSRAMMDLMAIAFSCDLTRVITFMLGNAGSGQQHSQIGVVEGHHELSHHAGDPAKLDKLTQINQWEIGELAYLLGKLRDIDDGDGYTALDNSLVFCSSEIEDGDAHRHTNLPVVLAGGGSGAIATGVHRRYSGVALGNMFVSIMASYGMPNTTFGDDGNAQLPGLLI